MTPKICSDRGPKNKTKIRKRKKATPKIRGPKNKTKIRKQCQGARKTRPESPFPAFAGTHYTLHSSCSRVPFSSLMHEGGGYKGEMMWYHTSGLAVIGAEGRLTGVGKLSRGRKTVEKWYQGNEKQDQKRCQGTSFATLNPHFWYFVNRGYPVYPGSRKIGPTNWYLVPQTGSWCLLNVGPSGPSWRSLSPIMWSFTFLMLQGGG